jgi:thioredoxin
MKLKIIVLFLITLLFINCKEKTQESNSKSSKIIVESIDPNTFSEKLQTSSNAQLIDVRTPEEFNSKHLENAVNIDYNGTNFDTEIAKLDKTKPTFVYCLSGGRSSSAVAKMQDLGFTELYNMEGGMMKWNALGLSGNKIEKDGMTQADFQKLLQSDKKVLVDFNAEWCGPCKRMAPYIEKMKEELKDDVVIISIDVDKNEALAQELKIESLPTLILYENQKSIWKNIGSLSEDELRAKLQ